MGGWEINRFNFLVGPPYTIGLFQLPQRYQVVNGSSAIRSGVQLLPYCFVIPVGVILTSLPACSLNIPPVYFLVLSTVLQILGSALLSVTSTDDKLNGSQYAYQALS
jgi:hypothetical protein